MYKIYKILNHLDPRPKVAMYKLCHTIVKESALTDDSPVNVKRLAPVLFRNAKYSFLSLKSSVFNLYGGKIYEDSKLRRINHSDLSGQYTKEFHDNAMCSAGISIEFITSSSRIFLDSYITQCGELRHMNENAVAGIDVYIKGLNNHYKWVSCCIPNNLTRNHIESEIMISPSKTPTHVILYLPLYSVINTLLIGVEHDSYFIRIKEPKDFKVLAYGSSITQGCAASRPGNNYSNILSRKLNCEFYNWGFSGSARGEQEIAQKIVGQSPDVIVVEYDHNASVALLKKTHTTFYKILREGLPAAKIIFLSRLSGGLSISKEETEERISIILETIYYANSKNDFNISFINGSELLSENIEDFFVDEKHPNDAGIQKIVDSLAKEIKICH